MLLGVYPMHTVVKVGDTLPDIEEGLNAGMGAVGLSLTGTLLGLNEEGTKALSPNEKETARRRIEASLYEAGAHYVIDGIWALRDIVDNINERLSNGEQP